MGRERQKKKNRSSTPKVRQKPKSKKVKIKSNPIVAANWNSRETLSQNYRRLGLTARLKGSTGGVEKRPGDAFKTDSLSLNASTSSNNTLVPGETRVERDADGNISRVIPASKPVSKTNPLNDPLNDLSDSEDEQERYNAPPAASDVVAELEEQAKLEPRKKPKTMNARDKEWVSRLVSRHGDDYGGMFWDKELNPMQLAQGELKQRVQLWKQVI